MNGEATRGTSDGTELDQKAPLSPGHAKEELQREVFSCVADELIRQTGLATEQKIMVANAVAAIWVERYARAFKDLFCVGRTDNLKGAFFRSIQSLSPQERVDQVFIQMGFVDGMSGFIEKEMRYLREELEVMHITRQQLH